MYVFIDPRLTHRELQLRHNFKILFAVVRNVLKGQLRVQTRFLCICAYIYMHTGEGTYTYIYIYAQLHIHSSSHSILSFIHSFHSFMHSLIHTYIQSKDFLSRTRVYIYTHEHTYNMIHLIIPKDAEENIQPTSTPDSAAEIVFPIHPSS